MDTLHGDFIWNSHKERANILKHGVDFQMAAQVFSDSSRKVLIDDAHSVLESRYFCMGKVDGRVLTVRFMYRDNKIRIIGAGYWRKGRELYEKK